MKRIRILLAIALVLSLLAAVGCEETTADVSSQAASKAAASEDAASKELLPQTDDRGWFLVDNYRVNHGYSLSSDLSDCFPEDVPGYVVGDGVHQVSEEKFRALIGTNMEGTGSIKWIDYKEIHTVNKQTDLFTGEVPVDKMNDPIWLETALPSQVRTYMYGRTNAENMYPSDAKYTSLLPIGAIYRNEENPPADDDTVTLCFKDIRLLVHTKKTGWIVASHLAVPTSDAMRNIYYLPWGNSSYTLPYSALERFDDHVEVKLTGKDFNGDGGTKGHSVNSKVKASLLHFWGGNFSPEGLNGASFDEIDGVVASYTVWIQEANMVGHFAGTIGADWREKKGGATDQAFSGYNYLITTQPTVVFGHNVGPAVYDSVMDSATVKNLLGL